MTLPSTLNEHRCSIMQLSVELLEEVFSALVEPSMARGHSKNGLIDLKNCTLVCRDWANLCRKYIFRDVSVSSDNEDRSIEFQELVESRPLIKSDVRVLRYSVRLLDKDGGNFTEEDFPTFMLILDLLSHQRVQTFHLDFKEGSEDLDGTLVYLSPQSWLQRVPSIFIQALTILIHSNPLVHLGLHNISGFPAYYLNPKSSGTWVKPTMKALTLVNVSTSQDERCEMAQRGGKVRRVDSDEGDTMHSVFSKKNAEDRRDATFVRYEMLVDEFANQRRRQPKFTLQTFYGQIEHIYTIKFTCSDARVEPEKTTILAAIRNCKLMAPDPELARLDIHLYTNTGSLDVIDITSIQALVGRVRSQVAGGDWAIIDRSGALARATYDDGIDNPS